LGVWSPRSLDRYVHPSFSSPPLPCMRDHPYVNVPDHHYLQARWWRFLSWVRASMRSCGWARTGITKSRRGYGVITRR
jgi:hypothetical protein